MTCVPDERTADVHHLEHGLWAVLPTPFHHDGSLDRDSLTTTVGHYVSGGAVGLVALGVFGEAAQLDAAEKATVVADVAAAAPGHRLVVGLSARDTSAAQCEAAAAVAAGGEQVCAVMAQLNASSADAIAEHVRFIAGATGVPVVLQDYPRISGIRVDGAVLIDVAGRDLPISAWKMEDPPTAPTIAELAPHARVPIFGGLGGTGLLDELMSGAAGAMTGFSRPAALAATLQAWRAGDFPAAWSAITPWLAMIAFEGQPGIGVALRKENLRRHGVLASATVRPPTPSLPRAMLPHFDAHDGVIPRLFADINISPRGRAATP
jgi:4-hydroxy-tetrahydrodipicolinate synthase